MRPATGPAARPPPAVFSASTPATVPAAVGFALPLEAVRTVEVAGEPVGGAAATVPVGGRIVLTGVIVATVPVGGTWRGTIGVI